MLIASTASSATQADNLTKASLLSMSIPDDLHYTLSTAAERRSRGTLQSGFTDICSLLNIAVPRYSSKENILFQHVHYKAGKRIHTMGQHFDKLFIVNSGFLKTVLYDELGNEQVLGFPMRGDLLGIDAIYSKQHTTEVVALSDCDLILLPYRSFSTIERTYTGLEQIILSVMSRELVREHSLISMLNTLSAEGKVARFLTNLGERFRHLGYSEKAYNLRMTRREIANYLGLAIETVSRTLTAFHDLGLIIVDQKQINIIDAKNLANLRKLPQNKPDINVITIASPQANTNNEKKQNRSTAQNAILKRRKG